MRAILTLTATVLLTAAAHAGDISTVCAVELARRDAVIASDYQNPSPPWTYWVSHDGKTLGPWSILQIKREMVIGRLPTELYFHDSDRPTGWQWSAHSREFAPLPVDAAISPEDLGAGLTQLITGCWVSDPTEEVPGQETVWIFLLMDDGQFFPSRGIRDQATGKEGFWFSRASIQQWTAQSRGGTDITLRLPDINYLDPQDDFTARVIDRNTLSVDLPGIAAMTFRRL